MSSLSIDERKALVRHYLETAWNGAVTDERSDTARHIAAPDANQQNKPSGIDAQLSPTYVYLGDEQHMRQPEGRYA